MKLEQIGFYTLSDSRAATSTDTTPLWRAELLLTSRCNFKCPYCRGLSNPHDLSFTDAVHTVDYWISERLQNIRFSGGEPTLYPKLPEIVRRAKKGGIKRIAISTNGSADALAYYDLLNAGVDDFSISLDACCSSTGQLMSGRKKTWEKVIENIEMLAKLSYVSVGVVINEDNLDEVNRTIVLAHDLGVDDIRIIPSAQYGSSLSTSVSQNIKDCHPILKYRLNSNRPMRGINRDDSPKCGLVLDDVACWDGKHYPCIIYLREGGKPIGDISPFMRRERLSWYQSHDSLRDTICQKNCLDVCIEFNNRHHLGRRPLMGGPNV